MLTTLLTVVRLLLEAWYVCTVGEHFFHWHDTYICFKKIVCHWTWFLSSCCVQFVRRLKSLCCLAVFIPRWSLSERTLPRQIHKIIFGSQPVFYSSTFWFSANFKERRWRKKRVVWLCRGTYDCFVLLQSGLYQRWLVCCEDKQTRGTQRQTSLE